MDPPREALISSSPSSIIMEAAEEQTQFLSPSPPPPMEVESLADLTALKEAATAEECQSNSIPPSLATPPLSALKKSEPVLRDNNNNNNSSSSQSNDDSSSSSASFLDGDHSDEGTEMSANVSIPSLEESESHSSAMRKTRSMPAFPVSSGEGDDQVLPLFVRPAHTATISGNEDTSDMPKSPAESSKTTSSGGATSSTDRVARQALINMISQVMVSAATNMSSASSTGSTSSYDSSMSEEEEHEIKRTMQHQMEMIRIREHAASRQRRDSNKSRAALDASANDGASAAPTRPQRRVSSNSIEDAAAVVALAFQDSEDMDGVYDATQKGKQDQAPPVPEPSSPSARSALEDETKTSLSSPRPPISDTIVSARRNRRASMEYIGHSSPATPLRGDKRGISRAHSFDAKPMKPRRSGSFENQIVENEKAPRPPRRAMKKKDAMHAFQGVSEIKGPQEPHEQPQTPLTSPSTAESDPVVTAIISAPSDGTQSRRASVTSGSTKSSTIDPRELDEIQQAVMKKIPRSIRRKLPEEAWDRIFKAAAAAADTSSDAGSSASSLWINRRRSSTVGLNLQKSNGGMVDMLPIPSSHTLTDSSESPSSPDGAASVVSEITMPADFPEPPYSPSENSSSGSFGSELESSMRGIDLDDGSILSDDELHQSGGFLVSDAPPSLPSRLQSKKPTSSLLIAPHPPDTEVKIPIDKGIASEAIVAPDIPKRNSVKQSSSALSLRRSRSLPEDGTRRVAFGTVQIREYERSIAFNPSTSSGPSIGIGWRYVELPALSVSRVVSQQPRRSSSHFIVSRREREEILYDLGYSQRDIVQSIRDARKVKQQRIQTVNNLKVQRMEEMVEKSRRKVKKILRFGKKNDLIMVNGDSKAKKNSKKQRRSSVSRSASVDVQDLSDEEIILKLKSGLKVKDRSYRLRTYRQCFVGSEAVDFMLENGLAETRQAAVELGVRLQTERDLFQHVVDVEKHRFSDEYLFFRFTDSSVRDRNYWNM